jgi:hypothetical protein
VDFRSRMRSYGSSDKLQETVPLALKDIAEWIEPFRQQCAAWRAFKFVTKGHPDMPFAGIYREVAPPSRLIFEALGATGRVTLEEAAGKTQMAVEIRRSSRMREAAKGLLLPLTSSTGSRCWPRSDRRCRRGPSRAGCNSPSRACSPTAS